MIGKLVAVRVDDVGPTLMVHGYVAQAQNRKRAWSFEVPKGAEAAVPAKVEEMEADRKVKQAE